MADVVLAAQHDERADSRHCLICTNYLDAGALSVSNILEATD